MNKLYKIALGLVTVALFFTACKSWTEVEPLKVETPAILSQLRERDLKKWAEERDLQNKENLDAEEWNKKVALMYDRYWEAVRQYKNSDHAIVYGWFGGWSATQGMPASFLSNLPDSVDMVSLWGGTAPFDKDSNKAKDLKYAQEVKGLKVLLCWQNSAVGLGLPGGRQAIIDKVNSLSEAQKTERYGAGKTEVQQRVMEYAFQLTDFIEAHGLDGYDIDYEPNVGNHGSGYHEFTPSGNPEWINNMKLFIQTMGRMYGPKSGREGKIFIIDGELNTMRNYFPDMGVYFDYFISQAYRQRSASSLQGRILEATGIEGYKPEKHIVADEFEKNGGWTVGGEGSSAQDVKNGTTMAEEKARWVVNSTPRKGGWAAYHIELEYPANYKYVRRVIQIQNPSTYRP